MFLLARWRWVVFGIFVLAFCGACTPLPEGPVKAYGGPDRPAAELSILQVSGCASAIRINGVDYKRDCNPRFVLPGGNHVVEVLQKRAGGTYFNCMQDEISLSWKRDFCDPRQSYLGLMTMKLQAGHVYYLAVCKWQQIWIEDLTEHGSIVAGMKPALEPSACPDLRRQAIGAHASLGVEPRTPRTEF